MSEKEEETDDKGHGCSPYSEQTGCTNRTGWSRCYVVRAKEQLRMDRGKMYQGQLTKFCVLWPIKSKRPAEVAAQLMGIFPLLGAQAILQSDNGAECTAHVISEIKDFRPVWVTIHGKPRHLQSQGSVER